MTVNGKRPGPLNLCVDHYIAKYSRKQLLWVYENEVNDWLLAGGKLVPLDPDEPEYARVNQDPGVMHVAHIEGTTLIRVRRRTYDRIRLKPQRERNKSNRKAMQPPARLQRWRNRIKVLFRSKTRARALDKIHWENLMPPPPAYFEDHKEEFEELDFDFPAAEAKYDEHP